MLPENAYVTRHSTYFGITMEVNTYLSYDKLYQNGWINFVICGRIDMEMNDSKNFLLPVVPYDLAQGIFQLNI